VSQRHPVHKWKACFDLSQQRAEEERRGGEEELHKRQPIEPTSEDNSNRRGKRTKTKTQQKETTNPSTHWSIP
jgi:hypothetical protein